MPHSETEPDNVIDLPGPSQADPPIADDDVAGQIEKATARLLTEIPDPGVRYQVAVALKDRLPWVQAVSAAQLIEEGDYKSATERLGVSRVYLDRLLRDHEQPTPRKRAALEEAPAFRYGYLLGVYSLLADRHDQQRKGGMAGREYGKHERNALAAPRLLAAIVRSADRWLRPLTETERADWRTRIEAATAEVQLDELPEYLTIQQQAQVMMGQSSARVRS